MYKLTLYYFPSCPYCQYVLEALDRLGLSVELRDIHQSSDYSNKLVRDTGRRTVPCLYIDEKAMHESKDIVRWLEKNAEDIKKKN